MEEILQLLLNRYIPYNLKKVEINNHKQQIFIYIKDSKGETLIRICINFKINTQKREYSWLDLRSDSKIELLDISESRLLKQVNSIKLKEVYKIEDE